VDAGITILNEVGLDPGIDHMTAMECFDEVKDHGGKVRTNRFLKICKFSEIRNFKSSWKTI
jgi:saccharopine dehydrogenase-like NADP-dependent oxidoreductase